MESYSEQSLYSFIEGFSLYCNYDPFVISLLRPVCKMFDQWITSNKLRYEDIIERRYFGKLKLHDIFRLHGVPTLRIRMMYFSKIEASIDETARQFEVELSVVNVTKQLFVVKDPSMVSRVHCESRLWKAFKFLNCVDWEYIEKCGYGAKDIIGAIDYSDRCGSDDEDDYHSNYCHCYACHYDSNDEYNSYESYESESSDDY